MSFQMLILISVLCFVAHSEAKWKLQDNVYIIDREWTSESLPEEVRLHCNVSGKHNASVYWKKDNNSLGNEDASLTIKVKESMDAGNFTCWSNATNELLNYTTLYIAKKKNGKMMYQVLKRERPSNRNFKCTANNYSGKFTCSWMVASQSRNRDLKFAIRRLNTDNSTGSVTCEEPIKDSAALGRYSVSCIKEKPCLSSEEYQLIEIGLDVFDEHIYESDAHSFFIKDILKPDVTECEIASDGTARHYQVTWKPPQTWSTPVSYFRLAYQIRFQDGTTQKICEVDIPQENGNRIGCSIQRTNGNYYIRSRDHYNKNSSWSEWSKPCSVGSRQNGHPTDDTKLNIVPCNCQKN